MSDSPKKLNFYTNYTLISLVLGNSFKVEKKINP